MSTEIDNHNIIKKYLNNNKFIKESNFNNIMFSELFMVELYWIDSDGFYNYINKNNSTDSYIFINDVISFNCPSIRYETIEQNLFNSRRNLIVSKSFDELRVKFIESSDGDYRSFFYNKYEGNQSSDSNYYLNYPAEDYFSLNVYPIRKNNKTGLFEFSNIYHNFIDCIITSLNDLDLDVSKSGFITCDVSAKFKDYKIINRT